MMNTLSQRAAAALVSLRPWCRQLKRGFGRLWKLAEIGPPCTSTQ
jgi:hypothetical protein